MSDFDSLFDSDFCIDKPIRLIELFGGIGSQAMALRDIGANFEHYRLVEFDKYACASYNAIHGTSFEPTDIRNVHGGDLGIVDKDDWCYLLTYSFPCQSLSVAGKMEGMSKSDWESGKSTRSGLLWEVERILKELPKECLPDILLMENVPQVHAEKNLSDFESWQSFLRGRGYQNFYADLNARDFGIPQNRVRGFMVSILSDEYVDFAFPETIELETVMKDYLEESVDEKYYINSEKAEKLIQQLVDSGVLGDSKKNSDNRKQRTRENIVSGKGYEGVIEETKCVGGLSDSVWGGKQYHQQDRVYKGDIALAEPANIPGGSYKYIVAMRGRGENNGQQLEPNTQGVVNALTTVQKDNLVMEEKGAKQNDEEKRIREIWKPASDKQGARSYRIRKLTPREVWRLMGYTDEDFDRAAAVNSNTQLYKEAGNAIVKQVLMAIFRQMKPKMRE